MMSFLRLKAVIYLLGGVLFLGFGLKASVEIKCKWSCSLQCMEDDQQTETEKTDKEEKKNRKAKKNWDAQALDLSPVSAKKIIAWGAAERAYLMAIVLEPLISVPIQ
ncbi:MAG: hypothetical protein EOO47_00915, partial [Flavobacterium sp.]